MTGPFGKAVAEDPRHRAHIQAKVCELAIVF